MRSSVLSVTALAGLIVLVSAPGLVVGSVMVVVFLWVTWRMLRATVARRVVR